MVQSSSGYGGHKEGDAIVVNAAGKLAEGRDEGAEDVRGVGCYRAVVLGGRGKGRGEYAEERKEEG